MAQPCDPAAESVCPSRPLAAPRPVEAGWCSVPPRHPPCARQLVLGGDLVLLVNDVDRQAHPALTRTSPLQAAEVHEEPESYVQEDLELDTLTIRGPEFLASAGEYVERDHPQEGVEDGPRVQALTWLGALGRQTGTARRAVVLQNARIKPQ